MSVSINEENPSSTQTFDLHKKTRPNFGTNPDQQEKSGSSWIQAVGTLWNRTVVFWIRKFVEGVLLRRQAERFYMVFGGHLFFQTLRAAVKFDLFTLLSREGAMTLEQIAAKLNIEKQPTRIMLLGLTATGILRKKGPKYANTRLSRELLSSDSSNNIIAYVELQHHGMYKALPHLYESIKQYTNVGIQEFAGDEPTFYERLAHDPELEQVFQDAMSALSVQTNAMLAKFVDLSDVKHLVDVGGGDGTNIITLTDRFHDLRATVFDLPSICEIARKNIGAHQRSDRLNAVPGNCFENDFPKDVDCFLFSHFFTIWSEEKDRLLLKKCYDALPAGGKVMLFNMMQHDDETGPLSAAVGSPYFLSLATGEGMLYTWNEYETWMREAGFSQVTRHVLPRDHGIIVGTKS